MARKLRVLAFHSFRTSSRIFQEQMQRVGLDKELEDLIEVTYINAPNRASGPIPEDVAPFFKGPYYEWWNVSQDKSGKWVIDDWEPAMKEAAAAMREHGPFDGVMGFSQGGAMASLVVALQRSGERFQEFPRLKFILAFAGIKLRMKDLEYLYGSLHDVESCHIVGDRDPIKNMTNHLIESFDNPIVINHTRGHVVPQLAGHDLTTLRDFLQAQLAHPKL
ncbi:hypothetical protein ACKKBG_A28170 [Auxenochlorella protothecoides x Auxenochlorella symbiontica]